MGYMVPGALFHCGISRRMGLADNVKKVRKCLFRLQGRDEELPLASTSSFLKFRSKYPQNRGEERKCFRFNVSLSK